MTRVAVAMEMLESEMTDRAREPILDFPSVRRLEHRENEDDQVKVKTKTSKSKGGFQALGLGPKVFGGIMRMGYKVPTPIQRKALPVALSGKDLVAMARTGSGKTAAFLIPLLERLEMHSSAFGARGLLLSPTRELAQQTHKFAKQMGKLTSLRICLLQGGERMDAQFEAIANNPDIIIATPGRLVHLLAEVPDFNLNRVEMLIFDEADRLFEMGFAAQLKEIMDKVPEERQTLLFSATMPKQLLEFARAGLKDPELIRLDTETKVSENLRLAFFSVRTKEKTAGLLYLLTEVIPKTDQTIIFAATRHHVDYLKEVLRASRLECSVIYGSMDMVARQQSLAQFRAGKTRFLLVTDVAARGIDIPLLNNVVNYDFPAKAKLFVHRVGRAARQGRHGTAFSLVTREEMPYMIDLHLFLGNALAWKDCDPYQLSEMTPSDVHFGRFPQAVLDEENERLNKLQHDMAEGPMLLRSMGNAHALYCKTRPEASRRSVQRSKEIEFPQVHPLFQDKMHEETERDEHLRLLRHYRPNQTVFEMDHAKKGRSSSNSDAMVAMIEKRIKHQSMIRPSTEKSQDNDEEAKSEDDDASEQQQQQQPTKSKASVIHPHSSSNLLNGPRLSKAQRKRLKKQQKTGAIDVNEEKRKLIGSSQLKPKDQPETFRDPKFYIDATISEAEMHVENQLAVRPKRDKTDESEASMIARSRLEDGLLDLIPDDSKDIAQKQRTYHWDSRKKKYIKATLQEHVKSKRIRSESGATINVKNRGELYEKWIKSRKRRIGDDVEDEDNARAETSSKLAESTDVKTLARAVRKRKYMEKGDLEVKDEAKIRKERKELEKRRAKNARTKDAKVRTKIDAKKRREAVRTGPRGKGEPGFDRNSRSRAIMKKPTSNKRKKTR